MSRLVLLMCIVVAGCGPAGAGSLGVIAPESLTFAPALQVDLAAMERVAAGVYVRDLAVGAGPEVRRGQRVAVHYAGFLPDGTQIDAAAPPGPPVEFVIGAGQVIRGWESGIVGMRVGGQRQLVIPPSEGYRGQRVGRVPPHSTLVFVIKLVSVR